MADAEVDKSLTRTWGLFLGDLSVETDDELGALLPCLVDVGYVVMDGGSPTGHFWRFTSAGVEHAQALGLD